jgi:site-specific DNA-adenine methylase
MYSPFTGAGSVFGDLESCFDSGFVKVPAPFSG